MDPVPPAPPASTPPIAPLPEPKNKIWLWVLAGVSLLATGITGGIFLGKQFYGTSDPIFSPSPATQSTPTTDPTTNWKTYTNAKWGYSVKYPADQLVSCKYDQVEDGIKLWVAPFDCPDGHDIFYEVSVLGYLHNKLPVYKQPTSSEKVAVAGIQATKNTYKYENEDGPLQALGGATEILVPSTNGIIQLIVLSDNPIKVQRFNQILSTFKFLTPGSSTKFLRSSYSISLPQGYSQRQSTDNLVTYGFDDADYLHISSIPSITLTQVTQCKGQNPIPGQFCLSEGTGWGQTSDVEDITLDNIPAKSFYIYGGVDNAFHVIQTTQKPTLELKMYVAGGGLDQTFNNILKSFKFTN